jgi:hypothetical protein
VHLERWRDHAQAAVDTFAALRQKTEESSRRLESPPGVLQFIDFFSTFFVDAAAVFERVRAELEQAPLGVHAERCGRSPAMQRSSSGVACNSGTSGSTVRCLTKTFARCSPTLSTRRATA